MFYCTDKKLIELTINGIAIKSTGYMNVLGITFDSKLSLDEHISKLFTKTNSTLYCIKQIKYYFTPKELSQIITSTFYSILYYNSEIWNIPSLKAQLKQKLLSASASALKLCTPHTMTACCIRNYTELMIELTHPKCAIINMHCYCIRLQMSKYQYKTG